LQYRMETTPARSEDRPTRPPCQDSRRSGGCSEQALDPHLHQHLRLSAWRPRRKDHCQPPGARDPSPTLSPAFPAPHYFTTTVPVWAWAFTPEMCTVYRYVPGLSNRTWPPPWPTLNRTASFPSNETCAWPPPVALMNAISSPTFTSTESGLLSSR